MTQLTQGPGRLPVNEPQSQSADDPTQTDSNQSLAGGAPCEFSLAKTASRLSLAKKRIGAPKSLHPPHRGRAAASHTLTHRRWPRAARCAASAQGRSNAAASNARPRLNQARATTRVSASDALRDNSATRAPYRLQRFQAKAPKHPDQLLQHANPGNACSSDVKIHRQGRPTARPVLHATRQATHARRVARIQERRT